jgi:predicted enzyme related to lactoylglutathione lyase
MKKLFIVAFVAVLASCHSNNNKTKTIENTYNKMEKNTQNDSTPKVTGVGGIFFFSSNPKETREWYKNNLGMDVNDYGSTFESRDMHNPEEITQLQWSPFKSGSEYFAPSKKEFMINYRVQNIEGLVKKLTDNGVTIFDTIQDSEYGKFVHIMDADGNKIELWEPK